ncbi:hypothetical protein C8Q76DRAFT_699031 [Earliella scabrosa]|nr:hypothetical protein C8Q76DRAFT_699031 [Earliella scabrosa]
MSLHEWVLNHLPVYNALIHQRHRQPLITLGNSAVSCRVEMVAGNEFSSEKREVFFLFSEYGKDIHAMSVCELVDGVSCANPPTVLFRVTIPDDSVKINFIHLSPLSCGRQSEHVVQVIRESFRFSLYFNEPVDFWEVTRTIAEAQAARELLRAQVEEFHQEVLRHVPTVLWLLPHPPNNRVSYHLASTKLYVRQRSVQSVDSQGNVSWGASTSQRKLVSFRTNVTYLPSKQSKLMRNSDNVVLKCAKHGLQGGVGGLRRLHVATIDAPSLLRGQTPSYGAELLEEGLDQPLELMDPHLPPTTAVVEGVGLKERGGIANPIVTCGLVFQQGKGREGPWTQGPLRDLVAVIHRKFGDDAREVKRRSADGHRRGVGVTVYVHAQEEWTSQRA